MSLLFSCSTVLFISLSVSGFYTSRPNLRTTVSSVETFGLARTTRLRQPAQSTLINVRSTDLTLRGITPISKIPSTTIPLCATLEDTRSTLTAATEKMTTTVAPKPDILDFDDSIYRFASNLDSVEGEEFCKRLGGLWNLASIHSQAENDFVLAQLAAEFPGAAAAWLGGFEEEGEMIWINGEPWNFENWAAGESQNDGDCVQLLLNANGTWKSENCASKSAAVVCKCTGEHCPTNFENPLPQKPDEPLPGAFDASVYHLAVDMDSLAGEEFCKSLGGLSNLASIHSAAENQFITALIRKQHPEAKTAVIGGYKDTDAFTWIDGTPWNFEAWGEGRPASESSDGCVYLSFAGGSDGSWIDEFCGENADVVVCKMS